MKTSKDFTIKRKVFKFDHRLLKEKDIIEKATMKTKICKACRVELVLGKNQYKSSRNHLCKKHYNERKKDWRTRNPEKAGESVKHWRAKNLEKVRETWRRCARKYPEKTKARNKLNDTLQAGKMTRMACEVCGSPLSEAHHPDYSKPLDVIWLCKKHHVLAHRGKLND